jgi:hypothetical protein
MLICGLAAYFEVFGGKARDVIAVFFDMFEDKLTNILATLASSGASAASCWSINWCASPGIFDAGGG